MTPGFALSLLIVLQPRAVSAPPRPVAWAAQSPRPATCLAAPGLWEVSRQAEVARQCRQLARAQALLLEAPALALERVNAVLAQWPELPAARVLRGRARLRLGRGREALEDLLPLVAADAVAVPDPFTLQDGGRAALAVGDVDTAARFYRKLGSGAALLPERTEQAAAYIEIASTLLASEKPPLDEVLAYLREARRRASGTGLSGLCMALTALSWVMQGREAEGQGALAEVGDVFALTRFEEPGLVWLPAGVFHAAFGLALEGVRRELAEEQYQALAATPLARRPLGALAARLPGQGAGRSAR